MRNRKPQITAGYIKNSISILLPTYNNICVKTVYDLHLQAEHLRSLSHGGFCYEIIVADDGSSDKDAVEANMRINTLPHCRYIIREQNSGRSCIRNFLARQAQNDYLLFLDSDLAIPDDSFLKSYVESDGTEVVYGGIAIVGSRKELGNNLRFLYEKKAEPNHTLEKRIKNKYKDFHTANFLIKRDIMLANLFDERFKNYGYEDVLFGKKLKQNKIQISHIQNPVLFNNFETNESFIRKTEEGLHTLFRFREELKGYTSILSLADKVNAIFALAPIIKLWHRLFGKTERAWLTGSNPNLIVFNLYRLGYFLNIKQ